MIHRNLNIDRQAEEVRKVKRYESGMVVNPITIAPDASLADALAIMDRHRISGHPGGRGGWPAGRHPDQTATCASPSNPAQPVSELMTKEPLITVREGVGRDEAKRLLHQHRIEKLLVVDDAYRCIGLVTVKDIEKAQSHPLACKDEQGRLRVAAAPPAPGRRGWSGRRRCSPPGSSVLVIDTGPWPFARRPDLGGGSQAPLQLHPGDRRQRGNRGGRPGAGRRRGGRGQGGHRPGVDLHHAQWSPASACRS